jgi:hypothetical protein
LASRGVSSTGMTIPPVVVTNGSSRRCTNLKALAAQLAVDAAGTVNG